MNDGSFALGIRGQGVLFLIIGGIQFALDSLIFILLTYLGFGAAVSNIASRLCAAAVGFVLHGSLTFKGREANLGIWRMARYVITWLILTGVSTLAVHEVVLRAGLEGAWYAKPLIEVVLAIASFFVMRHWVYK